MKVFFLECGENSTIKSTVVRDDDGATDDDVTNDDDEANAGDAGGADKDRVGGTGGGRCVSRGSRRWERGRCQRDAQSIIVNN